MRQFGRKGAVRCKEMNYTAFHIVPNGLNYKLRLFVQPYYFPSPTSYTLIATLVCLDIAPLICILNSK